MENVPAYVKILSYLFVVVYMLSVTLETTHGQMVATLRDWRLMSGALVVNLLLSRLNMEARSFQKCTGGVW